MFAHYTGHETGSPKALEPALHNVPLLVILTLLALSALAFAYWLLNYKSKPEMKEEKE